MDVVEIDSLASGEGGGQVLRSAISLASILKKTVRVTNIRAKRPNPGLQAQHIAGIKALAMLTSANVSGLAKGSMELIFTPKEIVAGNLEFDIGTAGSITLVLQALLPVLAFAKKPSRIAITGGTHVAWSPTVHYIQKVFVPIIEKTGYRVRVSLEKYGWYPKGCGKVVLEVEPVQKFKKLDLIERGKITGTWGISCASNLPMNVVERQADTCRSLLDGISIETDLTEALCPGSAVTVWTTYDNTVLGASSLGKIGKRAEEVGKEACEDLIRVMRTDACVDTHMADQVLIYAALAEGDSNLRIPSITEHMRTNMYVIQSFTGKKLKVSNENILSVEGLGLVNK